MINKINKKGLLIWIAGFAVLFALNAIVELLVLPSMGMDNTTQNDIYFQFWWVAVILWAFAGIKLIPSRESASLS